MLQASAFLLPIGACLLWVLWLFAPRTQLMCWRSKDLRIRDFSVSEDVPSPIPGAVLRRASQDLRRHRQVSTGRIDPDRTVSASARRAGVFTPIEGFRQVLPEYLFLIDRGSARDLQAAFARELWVNLTDEHVPVAMFYFNRAADTCEPEHGDKVPLRLQELAARYPQHRLLIFSDGTGFFSSLTGQPHPWFELFSSWPREGDPPSALGLQQRVRARASATST